MNIQLPDPRSFAGAVLTGWTVAALGGAESLSGAIIVKAAFDLVDQGGPQRVMVRTSDPARSTIVYRDAGAPIIDNKGTSDPADDEVIGYDLEREADIALQKARADIVVEGWGGTGVEGSVRIDGTQWLFRAANSADAPDISRNLFGWHSRTEPPRRTSTAASFMPHPGDELPPEYGPKFNNFYRRSAGFTSIADDQALALPSGKVVSVVRTEGSADTTYAFRLPDLAIRARLRAWCGDCPDEPKRWCIVDTIDLAPDALIVKPAAHRAQILWRNRFDWTAVPEGRWRLAQVMEGSA